MNDVVPPPPPVPRAVAELHYRILPNASIPEMSVLSIQRTQRGRADMINDKRLGVCAPNDKCATCGMGVDDCVGHPGHIDLPLPVFHIGFFSYLMRIMRVICKTCSNVMLSKDVDRNRLVSYRESSYRQKILTT